MRIRRTCVLGSAVLLLALLADEQEDEPEDERDAPDHGALDTRLVSILDRETRRETPVPPVAEVLLDAIAGIGDAEPDPETRRARRTTPAASGKRTHHRGSRRSKRRL